MHTPETDRTPLLAEMLKTLLHTNATIRLHNRATGDALPPVPVLLVAALAAVPAEDFDRLAARTAAVLADAQFLAESPRPVLKPCRPNEHAR